MQRRYRLQQQADIAGLRREGQRWRHPLATLLIKKNDRDVSRFGFSASRRVGKATQRNRAKRLLREAVRHHLYEIQGGWDCFFIARKATTSASFREVEAAILQLLARARIMTGAPGR